jgi:hypothetical protein
MQAGAIGEANGGLNALAQSIKRGFAAIKGLALLFILLEMADGLLTMWATNHGFTEVNSLVASYANSWLYPALKMFTVLAGTLVLLPEVKKYPRYVRFGLMAASVFIAVVLLSNLYEMGVSVI